MKWPRRRSDAISTCLCLGRLGVPQLLEDRLELALFDLTNDYCVPTSCDSRAGEHLQSPEKQ